MSTTPQDNKDIIRELLEEVWNNGNLAAIDQYLVEDYVSHSSIPGIPPTREGAKQWVSTRLKAFPDGERRIEDQIAEGDKVVTRFSSKLHHQGEFLGIAPTGKQIRVTGIVVHRLAGSKIVEEWMELDSLGMMQQLGVMPAQS